MFSFRNKKKISLNYPHYPLLSGAVKNILTLFSLRLLNHFLQECSQFFENLRCPGKQRLVKMCFPSNLLFENAVKS